MRGLCGSPVGVLGKFWGNRTKAMLGAVFSDDAFSLPAVQHTPSHPSHISSQVHEIALESSGVDFIDWPEELFVDLDLSQLDAQLQHFTLRELCPFGLDWSCQVCVHLITSALLRNSMHCACCVRICWLCVRAPLSASFCAAHPRQRP